MTKPTLSEEVLLLYRRNTHHSFIAGQRPRLTRRRNQYDVIQRRNDARSDLVLWAEARDQRHAMSDVIIFLLDRVNGSPWLMFKNPSPWRWAVVRTWPFDRPSLKNASLLLHANHLSLAGVVRYKGTYPERCS